MTETYAANTAAKSAANTAAGAIIRAIQSGASKKVTMIAGLVEALSAASAREFCKALGLWYPLARSGVPASITGATGETALATVTIPAGALGPNGVLRITAIWSYSNNANTKTFRYRFGGSGLSGAQIAALGATTTSANMFQRLVHNRNAANAQLVSPALATSFGGAGAGVVTASVDTSADQPLVFSGELANAGDTLTLESYLVEILYGA